MTADSPGDGVRDQGTATASSRPPGEIFESAPYGWAVPKGSPLGQALLQALKHIMPAVTTRRSRATGACSNGVIDKPVINGAVN